MRLNILAMQILVKFVVFFLSGVFIDEILQSFSYRLEQNLFDINASGDVTTGAG